MMKFVDCFDKDKNILENKYYSKDFFLKITYP